MVLGTQGTKGNAQVIVPYLTESYASSVDPPATETPVCLLHSFPNNIQHCLQWARELLFEGHFIQEPEITNNYVTQPGFLDALTPTKKTPTLKTLKSTIMERPKTFEECVAWARVVFEDRYTIQIQQVWARMDTGTHSLVVTHIPVGLHRQARSSFLVGC